MQEADCSSYFVTHGAACFATYETSVLDQEDKIFREKQLGVTPCQDILFKVRFPCSSRLVMRYQHACTYCCFVLYNMLYATGTGVGLCHSTGAIAEFACRHRSPAR